MLFRSNTVNAILSSLALIKTITGGPLAGIPLWMVMSPKTVTVPTSGQNMVVFIISLEYRGPENELAELGYERARQRMEHKIRMDQIEDQARKLVVAPHEEPAQEQVETAEEFYPEGVVVETASPGPTTISPGPAQDKKRAPAALSTASAQDHSVAAGTRSQDPTDEMKVAVPPLAPKGNGRQTRKSLF